MCTEEQHRQKMTELQRVVELLEKLLQPGGPDDATPLISASRPLVIDYKGKKHLFIYSSTTLTLTLEDLGNITIPQNTWVNIGFQQGMRLTATGQATNVPVFVRATDEVLP